MRPSGGDRRFAEWLQELALTGPRRAMIDLAAGLGKSPAHSLRALRWLAPWVCHMSGSEQRLHHLVAGLFATHPRHAPGCNFGAALAALGCTASLERRFVALLEADGEEVGEHLRRLIALLRAADIPLDWAQLLTDLRRWPHPLGQVQMAWAQAFWARYDPMAQVGQFVEAERVPTRPETGGGNGTRVAHAAELRAVMPES